MSRKQKAMEERYKEQSTRNGKYRKPVPEYVYEELPCDINYIKQYVQQEKNDYNEGYWLIGFEYPTSNRRIEANKIYAAVIHGVQYIKGSDEHWDELEKRMIKEWQVRNSKLAKVLK